MLPPFSLSNFTRRIWKFNHALRNSVTLYMRQSYFSFSLLWNCTLLLAFHRAINFGDFLNRQETIITNTLSDFNNRTKAFRSEKIMTHKNVRKAFLDICENEVKILKFLKENFKQTSSFFFKINEKQLNITSKFLLKYVCLRTQSLNYKFQWKISKGF